MKIIRYNKWFVPRLLAVVVGLVAIQAGAEDFSQLHKPRLFTLLDDKTITLKVLDWNGQSKKFQVENDKGRKVWVKPESFIEPDQSYFKEWIAAKWFLSNQKLYVSAKRAERGGYVSYNVSVQNKTPVDFAKVTMHYEVDRIVDNYDTGEEEDKNVPGKIFVGLIKAGSQRDFKTQPVRASETYIGVRTPDPVLVTSGMSYTYTNVVQRKTGKEKVNGVRLKFHGPKLGDVRIIREMYFDE